MPGSYKQIDPKQCILFTWRQLDWENQTIQFDMERASCNWQWRCLLGLSVVAVIRKSDNCSVHAFSVSELLLDFFNSKSRFRKETDPLYRLCLDWDRHGLLTRGKNLSFDAQCLLPKSGAFLGVGVFWLFIAEYSTSLFRWHLLSAG